MKLLPATVVHMSAKVEEIYPPRMTKYSKFMPLATNVKEIVGLEAEILHRLKF